MYKEYTKNIQRLYKEYTTNIQGIYKEYKKKSHQTEFNWAMITSVSGSSALSANIYIQMNSLTNSVPTKIHAIIPLYI